MKMSEIQNYFKNSTVFITGGTGFLGSLLVEKLLRTCKDLKRIYLLIRPKKNLTESERFQLIFNTPVFDKLIVENPEVLKKVFLMAGDIIAPKLGLNEKDIEILNSEVNCIFHSAANVKFLEKLRISFNTNVGSVQEIIKIAKNMSNLTSLVYVSTAFTNINNLYEINESFYDGVPYTSQQVESLLHHFDDQLIEKIKQEIMQSSTNIYAFNKSIAEDVIRKDRSGLPIAIVKPSVITNTFNDPLPGWIDNYYGLISLFLISVTGFIRSLLLNSNCCIDFVPADFVVNLLIASAWDVSNKQKHRDIQTEAEKQSNVRIYNCVNSSQNPITWGKALTLMRKHYYNPSSNETVTKNIFIPTTNAFVYHVLRYVAIIFPAYVKDIFCFGSSKSMKYSKICEKQFQFLETVQIVLSRDWRFTDKNTQDLWNSLSTQDKVNYNFNIGGIDWNTYCKIIVEGIRTHLFKNKIKKSNSNSLKSRL